MGERYALTVATPWYPTPYNRMAGSFVAEHAALSATIPGIAAGGGVHVVQGPVSYTHLTLPTSDLV